MREPVGRARLVSKKQPVPAGKAGVTQQSLLWGARGRKVAVKQFGQGSSSAAVYRVKVEGQVPLSWSDRLLGMNITLADSDAGDTSIIVGRLPDQSALAGVMNTLCENNYAVLSVECLEKG